MTTISPNTLVEVEKIATALRIGAGFNWQGAIKAFEGEDTQTKIVDGLIMADDAASIIGLFLPPANAVAIGLGVEIALEPFEYQALTWIVSQPLPKKIEGEIVTWGQTVQSGIVSTITGWFKSIPGMGKA